MLLDLMNLFQNSCCVDFELQFMSEKEGMSTEIITYVPNAMKNIGLGMWAMTGHARSIFIFGSLSKKKKIANINNKKIYAK